MSQILQHRLGILYALIGYTAWVLADVVVKRLTEYKLPIYQIVALSSFMIALLLFIQTIVRERSTKRTLAFLWPNRLRDVIILSSLNLMANYCCVIALSDLPLDIFYISVFSAPLMIAILGHFFLAERLDRLKSLAIIFGFMGVLIALWTPHHLSSGHLIGYLGGFGSASAFALSVTWSRHLTKTESAIGMTFFNAVFQCTVCGLLTLFFGGVSNVSYVLALLLVGAGIFNTYGNLFSVLAVSKAPAAIVGAYHYTQLLTGSFLAFLVWHEIPSLHLLMGALLIIGSGLWIVLRVGQHETSPHKA